MTQSKGGLNSNFFVRHWQMLDKDLNTEPTPEIDCWNAAASWLQINNS